MIFSKCFSQTQIIIKNITKVKIIRCCSFVFFIRVALYINSKTKLGANDNKEKQRFERE